MSSQPQTQNGTDDSPIPRTTREVNGIETTEIDVRETKQRLDGARAMVQLPGDAKHLHGRQQLPATVRVHTKTLREDERVKVEFDRFPRARFVHVNHVKRLLDAEQFLGIDGDGAKHVWDPEENEVEVIGDGDEAPTVFDQDAPQKDVRTWTHHVARERGWRHPDNGGDA